MALFKFSRRHAQQAARDVWAARDGEAFVYEFVFLTEALEAFPQTTVAYEHQREFAVPVEHLGALSRGLVQRPRCVDSVSRPQWGGEQVMLSALMERWPIGLALSTS